MHLLENEDARTLRKVGVNIGALVALALALILVSALVG